MVNEVDCGCQLHRSTAFACQRRAAGSADGHQIGSVVASADVRRRRPSPAARARRQQGVLWIAQCRHPIKRGCNPVTDFLDEKRQEIAQRLKELKPAVDEYSRLEAAAAALQGVGAGTATTTATATAAPRRRGPGPSARLCRAQNSGRAESCSARESDRRRAGRRRAGRREGSGTRAAEAALVRAGSARHHDSGARSEDGRSSRTTCTACCLGSSRKAK